MTWMGFMARTLGAAHRGCNRPGRAGVPARHLARICAAGWVIPGCGHLLLGRRWRALIFFACIVAMFLFGLGMKGEFFSTQSGSFLQTLGYFGELCIGLAMPVARFFGYVGDPFFVSSDYGTAFLVSAGMLNLLTIMDAYDITVGRKN